MSALRKLLSNSFFFLDVPHTQDDDSRSEESIRSCSKWFRCGPKSSFVIRNKSCVEKGEKKKKKKEKRKVAGEPFPLLTESVVPATQCRAAAKSIVRCQNNNLRYMRQCMPASLTPWLTLGSAACLPQGKPHTKKMFKLASPK